MSDVLPFFRAWAAHPLRSVSRSFRKGIKSTDNVRSERRLWSGARTRTWNRRFYTGARRARDTKSGLILVEYTPQFAQVLRRRYPGAVVLCMDAAALRDVPWRHDQQAGSVISGLPLLSMPPGKVLAILRGALSRLRADGSFYQFTYGLRCPIHEQVLDRVGLVSQSIGWVFNNFPPAQVFRLTRR
ncbi:class I SAM-dependent methyltransferase [Rhizobium sp. BT-175]|uniref:class I SAM-dependent methyltransferase n=1 Tax=Rhizobium sp. BT-175 TaxID=2986929 RepID=UPI003558C7CC